MRPPKPHREAFSARLRNKIQQLSPRKGAANGQSTGYLMNVEYFDGRRISGWVKSTSSDASLSCELLIDGTVTLPEVVSNQYRPDLFAAGIGDGNYGFDVALPEELRAAAKCTVSMRDLSNGAFIGKMSVALNRFRGNIDAIRQQALIGWFYMPGTAEPREIDIMIDGKPIATGITADLPRPDVHQSFKERLHCGYNVPLPNWADIQIDSVIEVCDSETGLKVGSIQIDQLDPDFAPLMDPLAAPPGEAVEDLGCASPADTATPISAQGQRIGMANPGVPEDSAARLLGSKKIKQTTIQVYAVYPERRIVVYARTPRQATPSRMRSAIVTLGKNALQVELKRLHADHPEADEDTILYRGSLPCLFGAGRAPVTVSWNEVTIFSGEVRLGSTFTGNVERFENGTLRGWAVDFTRPGEAADLRLLFNGIPYDAKRCSLERSDVLESFPSFPVSGFLFSFNPADLGHSTLIPSIHVGEAATPLLSKVAQIPLPEDQPDMTPPVGAATQVLFEPHPVSIVVPVYNAFDDVGICIESVLTHTELSEQGHHLILVNDASPDPRIRPLLDKYAHLPFVTVHHQPQNVGYTANVNTGMRLAGAGRDVVLLNSDTQVTPQWLSLLQRAARQRMSIGTVTAVSDNAGAFSVPARNTSNPLPPWLERDDLARQITHSSRLQHFNTPTGSGFCMYVTARMVRDIGLFDEENFPRGYGEENDFCMRGLHAGWEHVIADNVMIYHERSKSFLGAKTELMDKANKLVPEMYPEYEKAVGLSIVTNAGVKAMRHRIGAAWMRSERIALPRVAFVIGVESGGTPQTNMDLMSSIQDDYEPWLLLCSTGQLTIFRIEGSERIQVEIIPLRPAVEPISHDSRAYRTAIADVLQRYAFELVHIRHIGRHGLSLITSARALEIPVIFSLHDFYTVCPNVKLLDGENRYCGGTCTEGYKECNVELWSGALVPALKHRWVKSWQTVFSRILPLCDQLITTSPFARDLIKSHYGLEDVPFDIIPHARDFTRMERLAGVLETGEPLRIFMPGHLVAAKGLDLMKAVKELDIHDQLEFHFAGIAREDLSPYGVSHGTYKREELGDLIRKINPHIGAVLAVWPETYSHTVTEMWAAGLPIITTQLGATGERVNKHGGGWALEDMSAQAVYDHLIGLANTPEEIGARTSEVFDWQRGYGRRYSLPIMAERYKRVYRRVMDMRKPAGKRADAFVVAVGRKHADATTGTQHLTAVLERIIGRHHVSIWPEDFLSLIDEIEHPEALVIRYHGPSPQMASLTQILPALRGVKIVLDIAPDCPPEAWAPDSRAPDLAALIEAAEEVVAPDAFTGNDVSALDISAAFTEKTTLEAHLQRMKERAGPPILPLAGVTATTRETIANRLDTEILPGASAFLAQHNALLVDANFSLIDWRAMLTRPRVRGMVSIVVPVYNRVGITVSMVRSILEQTEKGIDFEIIVVDNGSDPEAYRQLRALNRIAPEVRLIRSDTKLMFSVGCNYGASFARGEFILFMNNDMLVKNADWLSQLLHPLQAQPNTGIVGARLLYEDRTVQHAGIAFNDASQFPYHIYKGMPADSECVMRTREMTAITGACLAMKASDWAKLRGFNPLYVNGSEDIDLCLRMRSVLGKVVRYVPDPEIIHLEGKSPGRGQANVHNRTVFLGLWSDTITSDDREIYAADELEMPRFDSRDQQLNPAFRSIEPVGK